MNFFFNSNIYLLYLFLFYFKFVSFKLYFVFLYYGPRLLNLYSLCILLDSTLNLVRRECSILVLMLTLL